MLSPKDNETLTRVGSNTAMGRFMREYWVPACLSRELVADRDPVRLLILGEKLIGFRDSSGRVGILDQQCPHRCASLFFGRNEHDGLRCVYHGWKFDVDGNCLEMPNVIPPWDFSPRVKAKAYRTTERNGVVWTYMGSKEAPPPMPELEATLLPSDLVTVRCVQRECNWLQALEGDIDTSHFGFLHMGSITGDDVDPLNMHSYAVTNRQPLYHVQETDWGTMYCGYRDANPGNTYYRFAHYVFPFYTLYPDGTFEDHIVSQAWVPMDDTHTMVFNFSYKKRTQALRTKKDGSDVPGLGTDIQFRENTPDWYGRWRGVANRTNDYLIDREAQRTSSFTGIESVVVQDQSIIESMGEIVDRGAEHLAPSDRMVVVTRRAILRAVANNERGQGTGPWLDRPSVLRGARSGSFIAANDVDWLVAYADISQKALSPAGDFVPTSLAKAAE